MAFRRPNEETKIVINLDGPDGNIFTILGTVKELCRQLGYSYDVFFDEMHHDGCDYLTFLYHINRHFGHFITFETTNPEYLEFFGVEWPVEEE